MSPVEYITWNGKPLACIIRAEMNPEKTTFITPSESSLQVGFVVYEAGSEIARHVHRPVKRRIIGTPEVLVVQKGRCQIDIYDDDRQLMATRELRSGDVVLMVGGGHGFRILEDTVFLEIKQGPYISREEKERF